jgi:predicted Zn finger-like uncharacterized protein
MAITVVCDNCGKEFKVKDELAGKKIKCPACQTVLTVPEPNEEVAAGPPPKAKQPSAPFEDDEDRGDEIIPRKGKKKGGKKSNTLLFAGIGCGLLLLCFGCSGGGFALYWFVIRGGGDPEKVIVGKWSIDAEETKKNLPESEKKNADAMLKFMSVMTFEFKSDNTFDMGLGGFGVKGKWKVLNKSGSTATVEMTKENSDEKSEMTVTVISKDRIRIQEKRSDKGGKSGKDLGDLVLKRI